ncbi:MAG: putative C-S lyase [Bacteroidales bacterium]|nr:putative C-S lyase [Bacteroidales bacterium]
MNRMKVDFDEILERKGSNCIKYDAVKQFLGSDDLIPMWVADMDFRTPSIILETLRERLNHEVLGYPVRQEGFFSSIMDWELNHHNWKVERDWIMFSPGVVPAVNMAVLAFTEPGDSIIVQTPVYFPFFTAVKDHGRKLVHNPLELKDGRLCMDFEDMEAKAAAGAKMIIISSPHNPGGSVWTREELQKMADICLKYNVLMISDEIHCDLVYDPYKHIPLASLSESISALTITTLAPSKTFNLSGLSTSSVIISDPVLRKKFSTVLDHLHIGGGNIFGNLASEAAYTHGYEWSRELMAYLSKNLDFMQEFLDSKLPSIKMIRPEATFLVWLDCKELGLNDRDLTDFFMHKAKLGLNPGIMFGPGGEGFMRLNIACPKEVLKQALEQLHAAVQQL